MRKVMRIGTIPLHDTVHANVFIKAEYENGKLSLSGVIGPRRNGNAIGASGQIDMEFAHRDPSDNDARTSHLIAPDEIAFAEGWTADKWLDLLAVWKLWHLNDMQAACEHQRAEGWSKRPIDPAKPLTAYGRHFAGQSSDTWNMLAWVRRKEHPEGLLSHPCSVCGYKYGTQWLSVEVPAQVIAFIQSLPDADVQPAWV